MKISRRLKVYFAAKLSRAEIGRSLRDFTHIEITSRWLEMAGHIPDDECFAKEFWQHDLADVATADVVLVYGQSEDVLRGALVEVGAALAQGKRVIACGALGKNPTDSWGTWQFHPLVYRVPDLPSALMLLQVMAA